jgi:hypothetical protein
VTGRPSEETPLPSIPAIPTEVAAPDPEDPLGWTYCYGDSEYYPIEDPPWYPQFSDNIVGALSNESNCKQSMMAMSPIVVVQQAPFLLETITAFVTGMQRTSSNVLQASDKDGKLVPSTLSDPFQASTTSSVVMDFKPTALPSIASPTRNGADESKTGGPVSSTRMKTEPTLLPDEGDELNNHETSVESPTLVPTASSSSSTTEDTDTNQLQHSSHNQQLDTVPYSRQQYDALASLINVAAQHGSDHLSSTGTNGASVFRPQGQTTTKLTTDAANDRDDTHVSQAVATTTHTDDTLTSSVPLNGVSSLPTKPIRTTDAMEPFLTLGDATATSTSGSLYVIGTKTLMPGGPAVTLSGTPISLALGATVVVVGSSTSSLAASRGIGDYVWAGIAGTLSGVKDDTISASEMAGRIPDEATDNVGATVSQTSTTILSTENGGRVVTAIIPVGETALSTRGNLISTITEEATNSVGRVISPTSITVLLTAEDGQIVTATISAEIPATSSTGMGNPTSSVVVQTSEATTQQPKPSGTIDETTSTAASDTDTASTPNTTVSVAARTDRDHAMSGVVVSCALSILMMQFLL